MAFMLTITLLKQPSPLPGGIALKLCASDISSHVMMTSRGVYNVMNPSDAEEDHVQTQLKEVLKGKRFGVDEYGRIIMVEEPPPGV